MPIDLSSFRAQIARDATRLKIAESNTGVIAKGTNSFGRSVQWLREAFGTAKGENRNGIRAFIKPSTMTMAPPLRDSRSKG